jgi:uncharacterized protein (TIGR02757 family)
LRKKKLGIYLDEIYEKYKHKHSSKDPVWLLHKFHNTNDIEIAGLITSCYSYGRVDQINELLNKLINRIGYNVHEFTLNFSEQKDKKYFDEMYYRFNSKDDLMNLFANINRVLKEFGSLKALFLKSLSKDDSNVLNALSTFGKELNKISGNSKSYAYLVPDVERRSACKRLNLYLRWMIREDEIDLGCWKEVGKDRLIFPVDTHVYKVSRKLGLINRKSCDLVFATELTEALKKYDPVDPVKYDFALCHIGIDRTG